MSLQKLIEKIRNQWPIRENDVDKLLESSEVMAKAFEICPRFWSKVNVRAKNQCWDWTSSISPAGYGQFSIDNRPQPAHRVAYELLVEKIPEGPWIDHTCMNRKCVNPSHLRAVTPAISSTENTNGAAAKHKIKTHCKNGHEFSEENTLRVGPLSARRCKICSIEQQRIRRKRARETKAQVDKICGGES